MYAQNAHPIINYKFMLRGRKIFLLSIFLRKRIIYMKNFSIKSILKITLLYFRD